MRPPIGLSSLILIHGLWPLEAGVLSTSCIELDSPVITAGDLAARVPELRVLLPELRFGFAPDIGSRRVIGAGELNRLRESARRPQAAASVAVIVSGTCVVRKSRKVGPDEAATAIRSTFAGRNVQVEVLEVSKREVAATGMLRFSMHELPLAGDPARAFTWNGWYVEPDGRKRPVWARVRLKETAVRAVAQKDLAAGEVLTQENVRMEPREVFPAPEAKTAGGVWGLTPRSPILAGTPIDVKRLADVPAIHKGDIVMLEAVTPQTRLTISGTAESTAYKGQKVTVVTSLSNKPVQATATGQGRAVASTAGVAPTASSLK